LALKISTLHSFERLLNIYQIVGRSQKTRVFINIAMKIANIPSEKQRKKIGKRENKENSKKKKKKRKKISSARTKRPGNRDLTSSIANNRKLTNKTAGKTAIWRKTAWRKMA